MLFAIKIPMQQMILPTLQVLKDIFLPYFAHFRLLSLYQ